jgi:hypothetical protein
MRTQVTAAATAALVTALLIALPAQRRDAFSASRDDPRIQYTNGVVSDPVAQLNQKIQLGRVRLAFADGGGYLQSLLDVLELPVSSQSLVFSETSAQAPLINPRNPRAVYFNDSVAVGWVRGGDHLEVAAHDPRQGVVFYTLDQQPSAAPQLKRQNGCLQCHLSWDTLAVPGMLTISTFPMSDDKNAYATGVVVDHRTPIEERWGGWYVTGKLVPSRHFGNTPVIQPAAALAAGRTLPPRLESVARQFDIAGYPSPSSDVVALMVLGHQTHMINLLTRLGWEARLREGDDVPVSSSPRATAPASGDRVETAVNDLVDYLLFVDEAPIAGRIEGSSGYAAAFAARGPRDSRGRSLRDLDLSRRLLRYSCSYMVYSEAFDALPAEALRRVHQRLWDVLSGRVRDERYAHLTAGDRRAIVEILEETKPSLPPFFRSVNLPRAPAPR